jgi:integrase
VNEAGQPYTPGALTNMGHRLTKAAGVRPIRLHDARHSCGTALHLRAVPMAVIAKWLGHADASITRTSTRTHNMTYCARPARHWVGSHLEQLTPHTGLGDGSHNMATVLGNGSQVR